MREVMVTGAAGGIGRAVVSALAEAGHQVTAVGRGITRLRSLPAARAIAADFAQPQKLAEAAQQPQRLDALVRCAGVSVEAIAPVASIGAAVWQETMIHADAYRGNLLCGPAGRAVLADWDAVSIGPREIDLVPTLQAPRFGLPEPECGAFTAAYQCDIRSWDGYRLLRDIRELSTLTALLNNGHADPAARRELGVRIRSMQTGDTRQWTTF